MTTHILIDPHEAIAAANAAAAKPGTASSRAPAPKALSFSGVLRSERIKLLSLRSIRWTLIITVSMGLGISAMMAFVAGGGVMFDLTTPEGLQSYLLMLSTSSAQMLALVFGVLGVFAIASEHSSGMILSTLVAVPKRTPVLLAKGLVLTVISGITAAVVLGGGLAFALLFHPAAAAQLVSLPVVTGTLGTLAFLVLVTLFAFGTAVLLRSTAGGISAVAGVLFGLPILFQLLTLTGWSWVTQAAGYLPISLVGSLSKGALDTQATPLFWAALAAMVVWAAATIVPAMWVFKRRDVK